MNSGISTHHEDQRSDWRVAAPVLIPIALFFAILLAVNVGAFVVALSTPVDLLPTAQSGK